MGIKNHLENNAGAYAWGVLATGVIAYDILCPKGQTLSEAVDKALEHEKMRYIAWGVGGIVAAHLFNILDERVDPIHQLARLS